MTCTQITNVTVLPPSPGELLINHTMASLQKNHLPNIQNGSQYLSILYKAFSHVCMNYLCICVCMPVHLNNITDFLLMILSTFIGSCAAAGYTGCCNGGYCAGYPPNCFCEPDCVSFRDCCHDFNTTCCNSTSIARFRAWPS